MLYGVAGSSQIYQTVKIPAGCPATLTYYLRVVSGEPISAGAVDTLTLTVNGTVEQTFTNLNASSTYAVESVNLSAFAGGSATIKWTASQKGPDATNFLIDSTALTLTSGPAPTPTPVPTAPPVGNCSGAAKDSGPLKNFAGTLATGVADSFAFPVQYGCNGAGYTAAVVIDDPVSTGNVAAYLSGAGVTQSGTITNEAVDGGGSGDDPETDLDVETIAGLAPGANIIVYDIGSLAFQNIIDAYNTVISDGQAAAVNSSFGACEIADPSFAESSNAIAEQAASEGVTFAASAGDNGSSACSGTGSAPSGNPYFTSVGGVNFTASSSQVPSVTMGISKPYAGGGGVSEVFPLPSYQKGISGTKASGRNQPDISLPFDPVAVYTSSGWGEYLGTSWSSPQFVAFIVTANEYHGAKLGFVNPQLYSLFKASLYEKYYIPCTSGSSGLYSCTSRAYNQAAGIGSIRGWALAQAL
jgi:hypothetical protein